MITASGTTTPDAAGTYEYAGKYLGEPCWRRQAGGWFLWWWDESSMFQITDELGGGLEVGDSAWFGPAALPNPNGVYTAQGEAIGNLTLSGWTHTGQWP